MNVVLVERVLHGLQLEAGEERVEVEHVGHDGALLRERGQDAAGVARQLLRQEDVLKEEGKGKFKIQEMSSKLGFQNTEQGLSTQLTSNRKIPHFLYDARLV